MKKYILVCASLAVALAFTSCGSKESAYRKAYEKAKAQEAAQTMQTTTETQPVVAPVTTTPGTETIVTDNYDNVSVTPETITVVDGAGLKKYSVVVGSFASKTNAENFCQQVRNAGYPAQIAYNSGNQKYRVVATTFDDKASAVRSRDSLSSQYKGAWLLFNQR
ncbi:MAG: SPOR domain-containing protein [Prevotella sp.]|jgi:cell division protein FtsN|nr:SPOR domain-containing protein [Prevotella sp.]